MKKPDLVEAIASNAELTKKEARLAIDAVLHTIQDELIAGREVMIPGLGKFKVADQAARTTRNPQTGGTVEVPAKRVPKFQPGKPLKDALND